MLPLREQIRINNLLLEYIETDYLKKYHNNPSSKGTKIIVRLQEDYEARRRLLFMKNKKKDGIN